MNAYSSHPLLRQHLDDVIEENKKINLTSITDVDKAKVLHIEDSLVPIDFINSQEKCKLVDIGSGAGFPGIPIAVFSQHDVTLVETVQKKSSFLANEISTLNLRNVTVYSGRIEQLSIDRSMSYNIVIARALSCLNSLLELSSPLLKIGGYLIAYKGDNYKEDLNKALYVQNKFGMQFFKLWSRTLSDCKTQRTIIVFRKIGSSTMRLPRKFGFAQKKPIFR